MTLVLVALMGGLGAAARFVVDGVIRSRAKVAFPVGTVTVNITGSLLIGLLVGASLFGGLGPTALLAGTTGFCGGYTTFSTAMVDTVRLVQTGDHRRAVLNAVGTAVLAVAAAALGMLVAHGVLR
jgi:CrcB protein